MPKNHVGAIKVMRPSDFHMFEHIQKTLLPNGDLPVGESSEYIIYGPYWPMRAGFYVVQPQLSNLGGDGKLGLLELCDRGAVLASTELNSTTVLTVRLPNVKGLEVRIKTDGVPFTLTGVLIAHLPTEDLEPWTQGKADIQQAVLRADAFLHTVAPDPGDGSHKAPADLSGIKNSHSSFGLLWAALNNGAPTDVIKRLAANLDFNADFEDWMVGRTPLQVIDVWADHLESNAEALTAMDFDIVALRTEASDLHGLNALYADAQGAHEVAAKLRAEQDRAYDPLRPTEWFPELRRVQGGFSKVAAKLGAALIICPFTGAVLSTQHCLAIPHDAVKQVFLFYRFHSVHTFYAIVGGFSGGKIFIYVPSKDVVLRLHAPLFEWGSPQEPVNQFTKLVMRNFELVSEYLQEKTIPAVVTGTMNNLGHFFWNEASGVVRYARSGYLDNVPIGILYKDAYIDPYRLISELLLPERLVCKTEQEMFETVLSRHLFCVRPIDCNIDADLASSIRRLAETSAKPEQIAAAAKARKCDYLLWVGLRSHNKVWLNQVDGLSTVIEKLAGEYETVAVYVDGTSDCAACLEELQLRMPPNVKLFPGIDVSIYDTIMWAFQIDSYIATIGSGLTIVTWIAGKPGVAHSESHHLNQIASFWGDVRPDVPLPITPACDQVIDTGEKMYCNYEIDRSLILQMFDRLPTPTRS